MARFLAVAALCAGLVSASPFSTPASPEPCGLVALAIELQHEPPYKIDGNQALACLRSVPLDKQNAPGMLKAYKSWLQFESNLAHLKQGLPGAIYPPVDVLGGLDDVSKKLDNNYYNNEYDLHKDIHAIVQSATDAHLEYYVDILAMFEWKRSHSLVSLSADGTSLPDIYLLDDVNQVSKSGSKVSPVSKINGIDVETWLNDFASSQPTGHDPDANYNSILWHDASMLDGRSTGRFSVWNSYQGNSTTVTFANGTIFDIATWAETPMSFSNVTDGPSFFKKFCTGFRNNPLAKRAVLPIPADHPPSTRAATSTTSLASLAPTPAISTSTPAMSFASVATQTVIKQMATAFPKPVVITEDYSMAGFLPDDPSDLAVLRLISFMPNTTAKFEYNNAVRNLIATAKAQGRKKLLVDMRGNTGGRPILDMDIFMTIFPDITPYSGATIRSTALFRNITDGVDNFLASPDSQSANANNTEAFMLPFIRAFKVDKDNNSFASTQAYYGPYRSFDDDFTAVMRFDLELVKEELPSRTSPVPQVFRPDDVVLLLDGMCASACADLAETFKAQAKVKSIVVGGRKQPGPVQAVGQTKGGNMWKMQDIYKGIGATIHVSNSSSHQTLLDLSADLLTNGTQQLYRRSYYGTTLGFNFQNVIRENDNSITPKQFIYEAADCRFFYTADMISNQALVWKKAYDIRWRNASCVAGSANHPSSLSGKLLSYINDYPPAGANYTFGSNATAWPSGIANPASSKARSIAPAQADGKGQSVLASNVTYLGIDPTTTSTSTATTTTAAAASSTSKGSAAGPVGMSSFGGIAAIAAMILFL